MYIVMSKWEFDPAHEAEVRTNSHKMLARMASWPEVELLQSVRTGPNSVIAIVGYRDEAARRRLVEGPDSPFEQAAKEFDLERHARWIWSEAGPTDEP